MTFKTQMAADMIGVFDNADEFATTATYTTPAGVTSASFALNSSSDAFIQDGTNISGRSGNIVCSVANVADPVIGGYFTLANGEVYVIQALGSSDEAAHTLFCLFDRRISPGGMR
jgi:hypothetical protein